MFLLRKLLCLVLFISICSSASADVFVIKKIYVNGLKRISLGTVLSYLPVKEGDRIDSSQTSDIIRELYKTGFFSDISLKHSKNSLIINVVERAVVGSLTIKGNRKIPKKQLLEALKSVGISEGYDLDPATLKAMERAIIQQYHNMGLYSAKVKVTTKLKKRNIVSVAINIIEGPVAKIKSIRIIGAKAFKEKTLLKELPLTTTKIWSFLTGSDKYSQEKLDAGLEMLRSFYMDRGYLHAKTETSKVSITPNRRGIFIVIKVTEGPLYRLSGSELKGDLIGKKQEMLNSINLKAGDLFSRKDIIGAQNQLNLILSKYGYGMPDIRVEPKIDEKNKTVWIEFIISPGQRVYIRNIRFRGNYKTNDEVLRREMRLQEGSLFSLTKINESRRRLANLGYLKDIEYKIEPVIETNNQVDLIYNVKETSAITANFQAGFSDRDGFLYGASLVDTNVFGTGKTASINFNNTKATQYYSFGYRNPYFTMDKIGFSFTGYLQKTNPNKISSDLSSYSRSVYGALVSFDAPLSDYTYVGLGFGIEHIDINSAHNRNPKIEKFLDDYGEVFNQFKVVASWGYNNFDRAIFPTKGFAQSIVADFYGPLDRKSLEFYKVNYLATWYQPLFKDFIFRLHGEAGYGNGIGRTKNLPIFSNFFAGGIGSVRGFEANTISDEEDRDRVIGGNILTLASAALIIPLPFETVRPSIFYDIGSVYDNYFKFGDLRSSCGIQIEWHTPIAPLTFSFAIPIHKKPWDERTLFQFNISTSI